VEQGGYQKRWQKKRTNIRELICGVPFRRSGKNNEGGETLEHINRKRKYTKEQLKLLATGAERIRGGKKLPTGTRKGRFWNGARG